MICFPNAKINLGLAVTQKRMDGYHDIETIFYPIQFQDALEFIPSSTVSFSTSGLSIPGDPDQNLILKTYRKLLERFPEISPLQIHLHKCIPTGGGLGGGSSDAAFFLRELNSFFALGLSETELLTIALELGSDCPFFIANKPALAKGRGELLHTLSLDLSAYRFILVMPGIHIPTSWAFSQLKPAQPKYPLEIVIQQPISTWKNELMNVFAEPVYKAHPALSIITETLYEHGAIYASMSGSGSTFFGIFSADDASDVYHKLSTNLSYSIRLI
jgi:4-diphosphocytidyl-2-C-methyl-D-erythritol kinase